MVCIKEVLLEQDLPILVKRDLLNADLDSIESQRLRRRDGVTLKSREDFHRTNWVEAAMNPRSIAKLTGTWLLKDDPELYVYENYKACAAHLLHGKDFKKTNAVSGFPFKLQTVQELQDKSDRKESIDDDEGDRYS